MPDGSVDTVRSLTYTDQNMNTVKPNILKLVKIDRSETVQLFTGRVVAASHVLPYGGIVSTCNLPSIRQKSSFRLTLKNARRKLFVIGVRHV